MSRDWSYRVWDKREKTYSDKAFSIDQYGIPYVQDEDGYWEETSDRYIFEFSTGLKDKNGKEIYEGDIIEETVIIEGDAEEYRRYRVYWEDTRLCWCVMDHTWFRDELWQTNASREVIGNVHENPELIGGEE